MGGADTIAAVSTPVGEGGIGIVRISGPDALAVASRIVRTGGGPLPADTPTHTARLGRVHHPATGLVLDQALILVLRAPRSFTGEDTVEIQGHGGRAATSAVLEAALAAGARQADPGEFTRRAFLNGRLDLSQAEAVLDVITARTAAAHRAAVAQLGGALSREVASLRRELLDLVARVEASLDFEEDLPDPDIAELAAGVSALERRALELLEQSRTAEVFREGLEAVIAGRPNVGKSSLLNALLREERAIVTPHPGTTRDAVEGVLSLGGVPLRLVDCAGIRSSGCGIEGEGVRRSRERMAAADLLIPVFDASAELEPEDRGLFGVLDSRPGVVVLNKTDLEVRIDRAEIERAFAGRPVVEASCLLGSGLEEVRRALLGQAGLEPGDEPRFAATVRQRDALSRASRLLAAAGAALASLTLDAAAADLRLALEAAGEITGETVTDDILDAVFRRFCIGK